MSCDEAVIRQLGNDVKKEYSLSLLKMASRKTMFNASPLAFSDHNVKSRIINVLNYKNPTFWILMVIAVLITAISLGFISNPLQFLNKNEVEQRVNRYISSDLFEDYESIQLERNSLKIVQYHRDDENSTREDNVFLVFRNDRLEEYYYHYQIIEDLPQYNLITEEKGKEIARQFAEEIFEMKANFGEGEIKKSAYYGIPCLYVGQAQGKTIYVTVDLWYGGLVVEASIKEPLQKDWLYYNSTDGKVISYVYTEDTMMQLKRGQPLMI